MSERRHLGLCLALLILCLASCKGQTPDDPCVGAQGTCEDCIQAHPDCFWCTDPPSPNKTMAIHCYNINSNDVSLCQNPIENPNSTVENVTNLELSTQSLPGEDSIQVRPQVVSMNLRKDDPQSFNMSFIALRNTPIDVYFLVDVSLSLANTITSLRDNLVQIAASIQNVSSAFRIGIGGFIDKDVFPYAGLTTYLSSPLGSTEPVCQQLGGVCTPTFGFRHWLELTDNITQFKEVLSTSAADLRVNVDYPEGSLDALMQVAVCPDIIGWRDNARPKMVFLITDNNYHIAGDGYLAGLVQPNDEQCHLEPFNGTSEYDYTFSAVQDYPSIHQVLAALERNLIVPIFSVQQNFANDPNIVPYQTLASEMQRIRAQAVPIVRTSNGTDTFVTAESIINLINEAYENTSQTVQILPVEIPGYTVTTEALNCPQLTSDGACRVNFGDVITIKVTVELTDCSLAANTTIPLRGPPYMFTDINVYPVCDCGCSANENGVPNSPVCNSNGTLQCGQCDCVNERQGELCECDSGFSLMCPLGDQNLQCSGVTRGTCTTCGQCECISPFFGDACECDNNTCTNCNGNGECSCPDGCTCDVAPLSNIPYLGDQCECDPDVLCWTQDFRVRQSQTQQACHSPTDPGNPGSCSCTGCDCSTQGLIPFGGLCLPSDLCGFFSPCVSCFLASPGRNVLTDCDEDCNSHPMYRLLVGNEEPTTEYATAPCTAQFDRCNYDFYYGRDDPYSVDVLIDPMRDCPSPLPTWAPYVIAAGIVLAIILLGLLILCLLKICFVAWDKKEYKTFTQELQDADFSPYNNPLYLTPQQEYQNPIRRNSQKRK